MPVAMDLPVVLHAGSSRHSRRVDFHAHPGVELVLVQAGRCATHVEGWSGELAGEAGTLHVLPAGQRHDQRRFGMTRTCYVSFALGGLPFDSRPHAVAVGLDSREARWLEDLEQLACGPVAAPPEVQGSLLSALLGHLTWRESEADSARALPPAVAEAVRLLRGRAARPVSLRELAAAAHLSPSRLAALFRRHLGCSPGQYQQRLRLAQAQALLRDPYRRVADVAQACGFADTNYFVRLFRQRCGAPPGAWRRIETGKG